MTLESESNFLSDSATPDDISYSSIASRKKTRSVRTFVPPSQRLWDNMVFRALTRIRLDHTIYPFTLKGEDYLNSSWKRMLDFGVGLFGSLASILPIAVGAVAIKVNVPEKSPFITRYRHGLNNHRFNMYKIRSQRKDTSKDGVVDPVWVGKVLRATSADELPQFWNVLNGDMSAVGRRPTLPIDYQNAETRLLGELPYQRAKKKFGFTDQQWNSDVLDDEFRAEVISWADRVRKFSRLRYNKFISNDQAKPGLGSGSI